MEGYSGGGFMAADQLDEKILSIFASIIRPRWLFAPGLLTSLQQIAPFTLPHKPCVFGYYSQHVFIHLL